MSCFGFGPLGCILVWLGKTPPRGARHAFRRIFSSWGFGRGKLDLSESTVGSFAFFVSARVSLVFWLFP
eukprot:563472-Amphidinium_carterae.2